MLGMVFQTVTQKEYYAEIFNFETRRWLPCSVELSEGEQIYDRFSRLGSDFESAVQPSPEHNVLRDGQGKKMGYKYWIVNGGMGNVSGKIGRSIARQNGQYRHLWRDTGAKHFHTAGMIISAKGEWDLKMLNTIYLTMDSQTHPLSLSRSPTGNG